MAEDTKAALHRLKRRVGRERGRYERIYNDKYARTGRHDERAFGEANVCGIIQGFIDDELAKLATGPVAPSPRNEAAEGGERGR